MFAIRSPDYQRIGNAQKPDELAYLIIDIDTAFRPITVGKSFKKQVKALMTALTECSPHYIRCIKPNHAKTPRTWDHDNIKRQVKYLGLLENVNVRRAGYAHRSQYKRFVDRYKLLCDQLVNGNCQNMDHMQQCRILCRSLGWEEKREYAMGRTKIFIQDATVLFHLEDMLDRKLNEAVIDVQKAWRAYKQKRERLVLRADAYDLVNTRKQRRRASVTREYKGDYVDFAYNKTVCATIQLSSGGREKVLFADRIKVAALRGKQSFFKSFFGKAPGPSHQPRFILLTDKAIYNFSFIVDPMDNKVKTKLYSRATYDQLDHVVMSPFADCYFTLHYVESTGVLSTLQTCRRKTEMVAVLAQRMKLIGRQLDLRFQEQVSHANPHMENFIYVLRELQIRHDCQDGNETDVNVAA